MSDEQSAQHVTLVAEAPRDDRQEIEADLMRVSAELDSAREALERLESLLSPEAMRGDTVIDDAYDIVFRALAALETGAM